MKISKETLQEESKLTGFKIEHLEKVFILMDLLSDFSTFPQLKNKIVLKGGTALNLFVFNLPRLSVDIDLNYIGNIDKDAMQAERPSIQEAISAICERNGLTLDRNANRRHAGGKMIWRYSSALNQMGNLEIDLNFIYRVPLWPIDFKSSCLVGSKQIHNIPVLDIHELSGGKLTALIDRKTGRDIFDAFHLLKRKDINFEKLRLALVIYSGINRKIDLRDLTPQDITVDVKDLTNRLLPLLNKTDITSMKSISKWSDNLVEQCQKYFERLLPITSQEREFLTALLERGSIDPLLISNDNNLINNIKNHPAIRWSAQQAKK